MTWGLTVWTLDGFNHHFLSEKFEVSHVVYTFRERERRKDVSLSQTSTGSFPKKTYFLPPYNSNIKIRRHFKSVIFRSTFFLWNLVFLEPRLERGRNLKMREGWRENERFCIKLNSLQCLLDRSKNHEKEWEEPETDKEMDHFYPRWWLLCAIEYVGKFERREERERGGEWKWNDGILTISRRIFL